MFVDRCKLVDKRSAWQKEYIPKAIINNMRSVIIENNKPGEFAINLQLMDECLKEIEVSHEKYLPVRYV